MVAILQGDTDGSYSSCVSYPRLEAVSLCLDSTSTHCIFADAVLWLLRSTHQGTLTTYPSWPSLAGSGAFASSHFARRLNRHGACNDSSGTQRASTSWAD